MTEPRDDTDPSAQPALESDSDPGPSSRAPTTSGEDAYLDRLLGGLRDESHFRPEPKQAATTAGESFAAHAVAPRILAPGLASDPAMDPVLLDITSPDGLSPDASPSADDLAVTKPLPRSSRSGIGGEREVETGPAIVRFVERQRRRIAVRSAVAALASGTLVALVMWGTTRSPSSSSVVTTASAAPSTGAASGPLPAATVATPTNIVDPVRPTPAASTSPAVALSATAPAKRSPVSPATVLAAPSARRVPPAGPKEPDDEIDRSRH